MQYHLVVRYRFLKSRWFVVRCRRNSRCCSKHRQERLALLFVVVAAFLRTQVSGGFPFVIPSPLARVELGVLVNGVKRPFTAPIHVLLFELISLCCGWCLAFIMATYSLITNIHCVFPTSTYA